MSSIPPGVPTHDNTMMADAEKCLRWYSIRHIQGLRPRFKQAALNFGGLIHDGLAHWYETKDLRDTLTYLHSLPYEEVEGDYRTKGLVLTAFASYVEHWGEDRDWEVILNETAFSIEDPSDGFRWGGRLDLGVRWRDKLWIVDHKSTSMGGPSWWNSFENAPQMAGYAWAGSILHGAPVAGVIINRIVIRKSGSFEFERRPYYWPEWKVKEWKEQQVLRYNLIAKHRACGDFPPNHYRCTGKYGRCPAFDVCTLPPASRARALEADFIYDPWDWTDEPAERNTENSLSNSPNPEEQK